MLDPGTGSRTIDNTPPPPPITDRNPSVTVDFGSASRRPIVPIALVYLLRSPCDCARDAIADRLRNNPAYVNVQTEVRVSTSLGNRHIDVVATDPGARPEMNRRVEIESKLGRASASSDVRLQVAKDAERLADNVSARRLGSAVEGIGRVARPVGTVVDAIQIGSAYRADGDRIGDNTQRAVGSLAGGAAGVWGGAQMGAAIGSVGGPVGTVVGGVVGSWAKLHRVTWRRIRDMRACVP